MTTGELIGKLRILGDQMLKEIDDCDGMTKQDRDFVWRSVKDRLLDTDDNLTSILDKQRKAERK